MPPIQRYFDAAQHLQDLTVNLDSLTHAAATTVPAADVTRETLAVKQDAWRLQNRKVHLAWEALPFDSQALTLPPEFPAEVSHSN